jgi:hypothetical protein
VKFIQSEQTDVTTGNFRDLLVLCSEFGSDTFLAEALQNLPQGSGEFDLPITQDASQRIYANEEQIGRSADKICVRGRAGGRGRAMRLEKFPVTS